MKQLSFFKKISIEHGGSLTRGKRNTAKPLDSRKLLHLVLKSNGQCSLFKHRKFIEQTILRQAELAGVKVYGLSVQHDHIHHKIAFSSRASYKKFVRCVTNLLSRKFGRGMWKYRPYTKIVHWGRHSEKLSNYIKMNELEVRGEIPHHPRQR